MRLQLYELWSLVKEQGCFWHPLSGYKKLNVTLPLVTALIAVSQQGQSHNKEDADRQENHQMAVARIGPDKNGKLRHCLIITPWVWDSTGLSRRYILPPLYLGKTYCKHKLRKHCFQRQISLVFKVVCLYPIRTETQFMISLIMNT